MRFKNMAVWVLLAALIALPASAFAEAALTGQHAVEGFVGLHPVNGSYAARLNGGQSDAFAVFSASGEQLSAAYRQIDVRQDMPYYMVTTDQNGHGLVDGSGREVIPAIYGDVRCISDHWILGCVWAEDWSRLLSTDVYFDGEKIGTLSADEFLLHSYYVAHGAYLGIGGGQELFYLNSRFERVPSMLDYLADEYFYDWNTNVIYHPGSGQKAFDPSCTLTADEVERAAWYDNGAFIGLQGETLASGRSYSSVEYQGGDYFLVRSSEGVGLVDMQGQEALPPVYDALGGSARTYFAAGRQAVLKDGRLLWFDRDGHATAAANRDLSEGEWLGFSVNSLFAAAGPVGNRAVFTAASGELPQRYEDVFAPASPLQRILCVRQDGLWGAIDTQGHTVIPFEHKDLLRISHDGTVAAGQNAQGQQIVYAISYGDGPAEVTAQPASTPGPISEPEPAETQTVDSSWICPVCGRLNDLHFCPVDGAARPVEPPACQSCGYSMPDGSVPNFCPNCGAAFQ